MLTLLAMTRVWSEVFWKPRPQPEKITLPPFSIANTATWLPLIVLTSLTVVLGLAIGPVFRLATEAGQQLFDPSLYVRAVLGGGR